MELFTSTIMRFERKMPIFKDLKYLKHKTLAIKSIFLLPQHQYISLSQMLLAALRNHSLCIVALFLPTERVFLIMQLSLSFGPPGKCK